MSMLDSIVSIFRFVCSAERVEVYFNYYYRLSEFIQNPKNSKKTKMEINTKNESQRSDQPFVIRTKIDAIQRTTYVPTREVFTVHWLVVCSFVCLFFCSKNEKKEILINRE